LGAGTPGMTGTTGAAPLPAGPLSRRTTTWLTALGATAAVAVGGIAVWAAVDPGHYARSGAGCVSVTIPSSTGGAVLHACGAQARLMCTTAYAHDDRVAVLTRPECRTAALAP
jgi:hypothetical protein